MTPKEISAGMNQLNGRKILILSFVSSDITSLIYPIMSQLFLEREKDLFGYLYKKAMQRISLYFPYKNNNFF